jgi:RNA polymerase sigma factor (sigma-70 family)
VGEEEFTALFHEVSARLFAFAARRLSAQAADDTVGQTFETVWHKRAECPADPDARIGWVFAIGRFKVLQEADRRQRKHHDNRFADDYTPRPAADADVSDAVVESAMGRWIYQRLTALERELFDVAFLTELTREQASTMLDISVGTFNTRVSRLRSRIQALQHEAEGAENTVGGGTR